MAVEIAFILVAFLVATWGLYQEKNLKRYRAELSQTKEEAATLKSRLEDRFYLETIFSSMEEEVMLINRYMEITDVNPAIEKAAGLSKEEIMGKHCYELEETELCVELFEGPLFVSGKSGELGQAFLNLIGTARETMNRMPIQKEMVTEKDGWEKTLTISTKPTSDNANIVVEIKDTGIEIPKDLIAKLPDPYISQKGNFPPFSGVFPPAIK